MSSDRGLITELKRRRVIRVAIAYVAIGLGVIYAADAIRWEGTQACPP